LPAAPTSSRFVFFILGAGRQVSRINESNGGWIQRGMVQQLQKQMPVDLAKAAHTQRLPKIIKHVRLWNRKAIGQTRKFAPRLLFPQATDKRIETKSAREQNQQVNAPQLSRVEAQAPPLAPLSREAFINEIVGNVRGKNPQKFTRANRWKFHASAYS
jgi:hypothetical protein